MLSSGGAVVGVIVGVGVIFVAAAVWPYIPIRPSVGWIVLVIALAVLAGVAFGIMPARKAARLHAADALRGRA